MTNLCIFALKKIVNKLYKLVVLLFIGFKSFAQVADSTEKEQSNFKVKAFIDTYFGFQSEGSSNLPFMVSSDKAQQLSINLAYVEFGFNSSYYRGKITPAFGSYMNENYSSIDGSLRFFYEANSGIKLLKNKELWLDVGIFPSPISNETPISKDHLNYTRALGSEYVPYYLTGARLSYGLNSKTTLYLAYYNGWQEITNVNPAPAFGMQMEYKPNNKNLINFDAYAGDERANNATFRNRYVLDAYWIHNLEGKLSATVCGYLGIQDRFNYGAKQSLWAQANVSLRYQFTKKLSANFRSEYFYDGDEVILYDGLKTGNESLYSTTLGVCYKPSEKAMLRIEARQFIANKSSFNYNNEARSQLFWGVISLSTWID